MEDREGSKCCNQSLKGDSGGSSEAQNTDRNVDNKDCAHEISEGNGDSPGNWARCYP